MRRQRWQHDKLDDGYPLKSDNINAEEFKKSYDEGKLRFDPNGNLITSRDVHSSPDDDKAAQWPIIDLDIGHYYVPSRTPGHGHLYINKRLTYDAYHEIMSVLAKHGIVGQGNLIQLEVMRHSAGRLPGDFDVRKHFYEMEL